MNLIGRLFLVGSLGHQLESLFMQTFYSPLIRTDPQSAFQCVRHRSVSLNVILLTYNPNENKQVEDVEEVLFGDNSPISKVKGNCSRIREADNDFLEKN